MMHPVVIRSRFQKADCLIVASQNLQIKAKAKGLDESEKLKLKATAARFSDEAFRHISVAEICGDAMTNRMVKNQT